jgi:uncharacterized protein (DUF1800 family)
MRIAARRGASAVLALTLASPVGAAPASSPTSAPADEPIVHVLNRLTFGPRPGDVSAVRQKGLDKWLDEQLHPERIPNSALDARLATLKTASLSSDVLLERYEVPRELRRELKKRQGEMQGEPSDQQKREMRRELREKYGKDMDGTPRQVMTELQEAKLLRAVYSERQLDEVLTDFWMNHFNVYAQKGPEKFLVAEYEREVIRPRAWGRFEDLLVATAKSPAMLFYLDNWLSADPDAQPPDRLRNRLRGGGFGQPGLGGRGRRGRPGGLGMPDPERMGDQENAPPQNAQRRKRGLNENYGRELMELHTLGVDGGYTQKDVTEVARAFTGWTIQGLRQQKPEFAFDPRIHDRKDKVVLGQTIRAGGIDEGEKVLHLLATHPKTAHFISYKLARKLVADDPPKALVDRAAAVFLKSQGDIREVVTAIVRSPEFMAREARGAKVKTPLEFVVSAVRASGASVNDAEDMARRIGQMGMPLYQQQPPTGYKDTAEAWVSTSGLLARLNFALDLASGKVRGVTVDPAALAVTGGTVEAMRAMAARFVPAGLSESTQRTLSSEAGDVPPARLAGLILGSPEFQRR